MRNTADARLGSTFNKLILAYNAFDVDYRDSLDKPTQRTTLDEFLTQVDAKKKI